MTAVQLAKVGGAVTGAAMASVAAYSALAWARFGHAHPERRPPDPLLDRFLPDPDVDEYHQHTIAAPAPVTFAVAKQQDFQASSLIGGIFWLREIPALLRAPYVAEPATGVTAAVAGALVAGGLALTPPRSPPRRSEVTVAAAGRQAGRLVVEVELIAEYSPGPRAA
jgi:hypothetical protein